MNKNKHAVALGREGGRKRAKVLDESRRIEIAKLAGIASGIARKLTAKHKQCQVSESTENKV